MTIRQAITVVGALALAACSPGPAPVATSLRDPSNPAAPEGVPPAPPAERPDEAPAGEHAHRHEHGAQGAAGAGGGAASPGPSGVIYSCPMHPEVTSNAPGQCPKCGMNLTPKK